MTDLVVNPTGWTFAWRYPPDSCQAARVIGRFLNEFGNDGWSMVDHETQTGPGTRFPKPGPLPDQETGDWRRLNPGPPLVTFPRWTAKGRADFRDAITVALGDPDLFKLTRA